MARELDQRDFTVNRVTPARENELRARAEDVSDRLPGDHRLSIESFNANTGNPRVVASSAGPALTANYVERALEHVQGIGGALGLAPSQPPEFLADPSVQQTSANAVTVHLQQLYKSVPIFQAAEAVRFAPDGTLQDTAGSSVTVTQEEDVAPRLAVQEAVMAAARHVATPDPDEAEETDAFGQPLTPPSVDLDGFTPQILAVFTDQPTLPTVLEPGPFGAPIKASLMWFPLDDRLRLVWAVLLTMPEYAGQYRTLVDAADGTILYCRQLVQSVAARGNVYRVDGSQPREMIDFPRALASYGLDIPTGLPSGFPDTWVEIDSTVGNCVRARLMPSGRTLRGVQQGNVVVFNPPDPVGEDQMILNIFYYNCVMHDLAYVLGFRERDGNFQHVNFDRGGRASDRVDARAHPGRVRGTANMATPVDGLAPIMNMGLVVQTGRHTAFDSSVVIHEFMHGVTNRLVGGPMDDQALEAPQSGGMGEGWGDYVACTINESTVVGAWVVNNPGGIRGFPYDAEFPNNFGELGTGRFARLPNGDIPVHNIGEIWCATLLEMNRRLGRLPGLQLVVDALKLAPANPSFLDMRDAILRAADDLRMAGGLDDAEHTAARQGIWGAFAKFGMGPGARSNGAQLSGIAADFTVPV